ncbi:hypothetical protein R1sor_016279 [Riccia sorocarpa]|uniref:BTB domain-containing protein n=1 Tax=Riccia sorocarpa TaxID=122646 RepID=A0ABD3HEJ2_9MARC
MMASGIVVDSRTLSQFDKQLRHMVDNGEFSNVTFVCEDGCRVHALRQLLAGRSPYFKQLLLGDMIESTNSSVELPTVSSSVLILVMKFLYTGKLTPEDFASSTSGVLPSPLGYDRFQPDWNFVVKAAAAARFFMLDFLGNLLIDQLQEDVTEEVYSGAEDSLIQLAKRFSILYEYPSLRAVGIEDGYDSIETLSSSMVEALRNHDLSPATLSSFSEAAFCSYIEKSAEDSGYVTSSAIRALLLDDYLRLRQILTWCIVSKECGAFEYLDHTCLPGAEIAIEFIDLVEDDFSRPELDFSRGRASFMSRIAKGSLKPLLKYVDFTCIPTRLLCGVVEPLGILEPVELAEVFRTQAMRNSRQIREDLDAALSNVWHVSDESLQNIWRVPVGIDTTVKFTVRRKIDYLAVNAVAGLMMSTSKPREWDIIVTPGGSLEQQNMACFEFGFIALDCDETFDDLRGPLSADPRCSAVQLGCDLKTVVGFSNGRETRRWTLYGDEFIWSEAVILSIKDDLSKTAKMSSKISYFPGRRKFSFSVAKEKVIYPAIYLPLRASGQMPFNPHYDHLLVFYETSGSETGRARGKL